MDKLTATELADKLMSSLTMEYDCDEYMEQAATMLRQQQTDLDIALSYIKQYELQIKDLKQQVAFLEDWRDTWSPTIKQLMNINVKAQEK